MASSITFSIVITVLNEAGSIIPLLDSLINQTLKPDEIIVVDAGSTDKTVILMREWQKNTKIDLKLMEAKGCNRSVGRNFGITRARNEWVAVTDGGCVAHINWLKNLSESSIKQRAQAVAGFYRTVINDDWQQLFSWYLAVQPEDFSSATYLPSSRSLAFTKSIWLQVGKYPEYLDTCEDLIFAKKLKDTTQMTVAEKALVYWQLPVDLPGYFKLVAGYAKGDVRAKYYPHLIRHLGVWLRYIVFIFIPYFFIGYMFYPICKFRRKMRTNLIMKSIIVQLITDLGVMWGGVLSIWQLFDKFQP